MATDTISADDPPILGANPFVGLTRRQIAAALARLLQRVAVEPGVALAGTVEATSELLRVAVGRSDVAPSSGDRRFTDSAWSDNPLYHRLLQAPLVLGFLATPLRYSPAFMQRVARVLYGPPTAADSETLRAQIVARRARPPSLWGYVGQLTATVGWTSFPWLHRVHQPTLVISGDRDPIVPPVNARILTRRIPNARLDLVHGAGHLLLAEQADQSAATIATFLTGSELA